MAKIIMSARTSSEAEAEVRPICLGSAEVITARSCRFVSIITGYHGGPKGTAPPVLAEPAGQQAPASQTAARINGIPRTFQLNSAHKEGRLPCCTGEYAWEISAHVRNLQSRFEVRVLIERLAVVVTTLPEGSLLALM